MPLIQCPDCGNAVSDAAPACRQCGRPIAAQAAPPTVKVDKSGARAWKVAGTISCCISPFACAAGTAGSTTGTGLGFATFFGGILIFAIGRIME